MSILTLVGALLLTMAWLLPTQEVYSPLRGPSGAETEALEKKAQDMTRELDALAKKIQDATAQASKIEEQNSTASPEAARLPPVPVPAGNAAQRSVDALMVRFATELDKLRATYQQPQGSPELDAEIAKLEAQMQELRSNEQN